MRVLIIEDEKKMAQMLKRALDEKGHVADIAFTGAHGLERAQSAEYDIIVLDLMLPDTDGFTVAQTLRALESPVPILILTARDTVADMVRALDLGADDYLTKPFALAEFMARLRAISRRGPVLQPSILSAGDLTLNPATCEVFRNGLLLSLTKTEYLLLECGFRGLRPETLLCDGNHRHPEQVTGNLPLRNNDRIQRCQGMGRRLNFFPRKTLSRTDFSSDPVAPVSSFRACACYANSRLKEVNRDKKPCRTSSVRPCLWIHAHLLQSAWTTTCFCADRSFRAGQ